MNMAGIGDEFFRKTIYSRTRHFPGYKPERRADPFKQYAGSRKLKMEAPALPKGSLWESLAKRRSRREFKREAISREQLALLIWSGQGVTSKISGFVLRTAPSAGALFPVESYLVVNRVEGVEPGIYHWNILEQSLEEIRSGDCSREIEDAALSQEMCEKAAAVFIWSAVFSRSTFKYSDRGYRYIFVDAGHVCQNLYLACEDLGLGCCAIGAFFDDQVDELLGLRSEDESSIYLAAVGKY
jgi:SagB-type dehydrogenase family enzyme